MLAAATHPHPAMTTPGPTLGHTLGLIVAGLKQALSRQRIVERSTDVLLLALWNRLGVLVRRFAALEARFLAGKPALTRRAPIAPASPRRPARPHGTPRDFGWLLRVVGRGQAVPDVAMAGQGLRQFFADPRLSELLAAQPGAARALRPLFRMLAVPFPPAPRRPGRPKPPAEPPEPPTAAAPPEASPPPRRKHRRVPFALRRSFRAT